MIRKALAERGAGLRPGADHCAFSNVPDRRSVLRQGSIFCLGRLLLVLSLSFELCSLSFTFAADTSRRLNRLPPDQLNSLPAISTVATNRSDRFIVDFSDTSDGHVFRGANSQKPHTGAHIYFNNSNSRWPEGGAPEKYPPIYAATDGIVTAVTTNFRLTTGADRYGLDIAFARDARGEALKFCYSIEPFIPEPSPGFYERFIKVSIGQRVKKGDIIGYMFVPPGQMNTHIHFHIMRMGGGSGFMAPAIFNDAVAKQFHEQTKKSRRSWDGEIVIPPCFGYKITAEENPYGAGERETL
jgi:hypothetical protein